MSTLKIVDQSDQVLKLFVDLQLDRPNRSIADAHPFASDEPNEYASDEHIRIESSAIIYRTIEDDLRFG